MDKKTQWKLILEGDGAFVLHSKGIFFKADGIICCKAGWGIVRNSIHIAILLRTYNEITNLHEYPQVIL